MAAPLTILAVRLLLTRPVQLVLQKYGPSFFGGTGLATALARWERLRDWAGSDAEATALVSGPEGYPVTVASFAPPFELRKVQFIWSVKDAAIPQEDARVCTFHFLKVAAGAPVAQWDPGDFTTIDGLFSTWWNALDGYFSEELTWDRIKFYKDGPGIVPPQVPVYDADKNLPGLDTNAPCPPQVAISVTEISGAKRHWGRFYLPAPTVVYLTSYGRLAAAVQTGIADATDALYTAARAAGFEPVVYRPALPARFTRAAERLGAEEPDIPAREASCWTVEKIQVDDVLDVIRRRRFKYPTLRVQRDVA